MCILYFISIYKRPYCCAVRSRSPHISTMCKKHLFLFSWREKSQQQQKKRERKETDSVKWTRILFCAHNKSLFMFIFLYFCCYRCWPLLLFFPRFVRFLSLERRTCIKWYAFGLSHSQNVAVFKNSLDSFIRQTRSRVAFAILLYTVSERKRNGQISASKNSKCDFKDKYEAEKRANCIKNIRTTTRT